MDFLVGLFVFSYSDPIQFHSMKTKVHLLIPTPNTDNILPPKLIQTACRALFSKCNFDFLRTLCFPFSNCKSLINY